MIATTLKTIAATAIAAVAALATTGTAAGAATVFSDNFNNPAYANGGIFADFSDRWVNTNYYSSINNINGWTFTGNVLYSVNAADGDGAVLLNETGGVGVATRAITGLTPGSRYSLQFLLSGDNRPGDDYVLNGSIDNVSLFSITGTDGAPGTNPGSLLSYIFTAGGTSALLTFSQASQTAASPMLDNVSVAAIPEPATWFLLVAGFGMVGVAARRRKTAIAA